MLFLMVCQFVNRQLFLNPLIKDNLKRVLGDVKFFDGSLGVSKELVRQLNLRGITFDNKSYRVEFIDSSGDASKEKKFRELLISR